MIHRVEISQQMREQIEAHASQAYPNECCGMIFAAKETGRLSRVRPCVNAQDKYHTLDPKAFPRTANKAYFIEPLELLKIEKELRTNDETIAIIYHSHPDVGAYFSEEDVRQAIVDESPIYPGTAYLVMSVIRGEVADQKTFYWDETQARFIE